MGKRGPKPKPLAERLERLSFRTPSGCQIWLATLDKDGYGRITCTDAPGVQVRRKAATVSYELKNGPVPKGFELDHLCRVPYCIAEPNLEAVTHKENVRRGAARGMFWREATSA
jgi:hypothetical protein